MKSIWTNVAAKFDPVGVGIIWGVVTPDCIRGYSNLCPAGTARREEVFDECLEPVEVPCS